AGDLTPSAGSALSPVSVTSAGEAAPSTGAAPLTRRQIRARERAEEARRQAQHATDGAADAPAVSAEEPAGAGSAEEPAAGLPEQAVARTVTESDQPRRTAKEKTAARRWLPRVAVLGALAAVTTVVPLTGAALPT